MLGASTVINPIIKIVTTVVILGAVYLFFVKPALDTTENITNSVNESISGSFDSFDDAFDQAQDAGRDDPGAFEPEGREQAPRLRRSAADQDTRQAPALRREVRPVAA